MSEFKKSVELNCSFCSKSKDSVKTLIAGPGVYICDGCVQRCNTELRNEQNRPKELTTDRLKCSFCKKNGTLVERLCAGPSSYICNECVDLCNEILDEVLDQKNK